MKDIQERRVMASITNKKLDDEVKDALRVRGAQNERSMEEETRLIIDNAPCRTKNRYTRKYASLTNRAQSQSLI